MSQPYRLNSPLPVIGAVLFGLLLGMYLFLFGRKRNEKRNAGGPVARHTEEKRPDEVLKHWTEERMRKAQPAKMPHLDGTTQDKKQNAPDNTSRSE